MKGMTSMSRPELLNAMSCAKAKARASGGHDGELEVM